MAPMNTRLYGFLVLICAAACCVRYGRLEDFRVASGPGEQVSVVARSEPDDDRDLSKDRNASRRAVPGLFQRHRASARQVLSELPRQQSAQGGVVLDVFATDVRISHKDRSCCAWPTICEPRTCRRRESLVRAPRSWRPSIPGSTQRLSTESSGAGRVAVRRLNRAEYNNTIRDLIGLDLRPADEFPSDDVGYGFDNIGEVLSTPPVLLEMYLAAAEKVIDEAFRSAAVRERLMNPPVDTVPRAFRKYRPPVRSPREDKIFRAASGRSGPRAGTTATHLRYSSRLLRPRLPPARDARRADALARHRAVGREGRRAPRVGDPACAPRPCWCRPISCSFGSSIDHDPALDERLGADQRLRSGLSALVFPLEQHARRGALSPGRPGIAASSRTTFASRSNGCCGIRKVASIGRKLRQPVAADAQAQGVHARPGPLSRVRRVAEDGDARRRRSSSSSRSETRTAACSNSSTRTTRSSTSAWRGTTASPASRATGFAGSRWPARRGAAC